MHTLHLSALDSRYANDDEIDAAQIKASDLPLDFDGVMAHQARTIAALRSSDSAIVINTAKTGDGKSFTGLYPALALGWKTMTLYPTNELARDQIRALHDLKKTWQIASVQRTRPSLINAAMIDRYERDLEGGRADTLLRLLDDMVLTNPDIFHLIMQFRYRAAGAAIDTLTSSVANRYRLFTFDEFHIFGAAENSAALIAMMTLSAMQGVNYPTKYLFLSATPQEQLLELALRAEIPVTVIDGDYLYGSQEKPQNYRRITEAIDLHLIARGDGLEAWVEANIDLIIKFFIDNRPGAKGVIIANSIATAYRVHQRLVAPCAAAGIDLPVPNTGLTDSEDRRLDGDLIIATSTIDVGVDFKINFLIFESMDAATHMQRLGRVGRHAASRDGDSFSRFVAYALLPLWAVDLIAQRHPDGSIVNRDDYGKTISEAYPGLQQFNVYRTRWGGVQAGHVIKAMNSKEIKYEYEVVRTQLMARFAKPFGRYLDRLKEVYDATHIYDDATAFRGTSPFTALVSNMISEVEKNTVLSYNLITLLRSGDLMELPLEDAYHMAGEHSEILKKRSPLAAYRLFGWLLKPRQIEILLNLDTDDWGSERFEQVIESHGFRFAIEGPPIPELAALNHVLERRTLVAILVRNASPDSLRMRYQLGMQLELFAFRSVDGNLRGCAAFGRDALLLDSIVFRDKRLMQDNSPMFG